MEEKDRYELFGEHCIKDNNTNARCQLLNAYVACVILNEQDKRIKELEQENLSLQEQSIRDNQNWIEETTHLKQQLHDLPKKIVEEIRKQICEDCFWEECEEQHCEFYFIIEYLNAILKRLGGENE